MSQQMVNGSRHDGSRTLTNRMSDRYAVVGEPYKGKHLKPQDPVSKKKRKLHWKIRWEEYWAARLTEILPILERTSK